MQASPIPDELRRVLQRAHERGTSVTLMAGEVNTICRALGIRALDDDPREIQEPVARVHGGDA